MNQTNQTKEYVTQLWQAKRSDGSNIHDEMPCNVA